MYYGTDTRAHELLIGATFASLLLMDARVTRRVATACQWLALPAVLVDRRGLRVLGREPGVHVPGRSRRVRDPVGNRDRGLLDAGAWRLTRVLGSRPMRSIGVVSYGLYLWHWPVMMFLNEERAGFGGVGLLLTQLALSGVLAAASYRWIEMPIRRNGWSALIPRDRQAARVVVAVAVPVLVIGTFVMPQSTWYVRPASAAACRR